MSGLGGQREPGESHQESVTIEQTKNQAIIEPSRSIESMVLNWLDLEFGNKNIKIKKNVSNCRLFLGLY